MVGPDRLELEAWYAAAGRSQGKLHATLRELVSECEWPRCQLHGAEVAHLTSRGMGGTPDGRRNTLDNVAWLCTDHARISDGLYGSGGPDQYDHAHAVLLGPAWLATGRGHPRLAYLRAEALRQLVRSSRGWAT